MILQYVSNTGIQYFCWVLQHTLTVTYISRGLKHFFRLFNFVNLELNTNTCLVISSSILQTILDWYKIKKLPTFDPSTLGKPEWFWMLKEQLSASSITILHN